MGPNNKIYLGYEIKEKNKDQKCLYKFIEDVLKLLYEVYNEKYQFRNFKLEKSVLSFESYIPVLD